MQKIIKEIKDAIIIITSLPDTGYVVCCNGRYAIHYDGNDGYTFWDYPLDVLDFDGASAIADDVTDDSNLVSIENVLEYKQEALRALNDAYVCLTLRDYADECGN